jgi:hypothetical protein
MRAVRLSSQLWECISHNDGISVVLYQFDRIYIFHSKASNSVVISQLQMGYLY